MSWMSKWNATTSRRFLDGIPRKTSIFRKGINDYTFGAEIPFLSAWRTWRVYDGMYMADKLRNELNLRILGKKVADERDWEGRARNIFGGGLFGANTARRSYTRGVRGRWWGRPTPTNVFTTEAKPSGEQGEPVFAVVVKPVAEREGQEFVADIALPAGAWIEGMRLKMTNGVWKTARPSERKAAEWVYNKITEFPVGKEGREVELTIRLPSADASSYVVVFNGEPVANPLYSGGDALYTADGAAVSAVPAAWMNAHTNELVAAGAGEVEKFDIDDPELMRKLRRRLREASKAMARDCSGVMPNIKFEMRKDDLALPIDILSTNILSKADLAILRRELPGLASLGDRPLDGWFFLDGEDGGKVAVPCRKGNGGSAVLGAVVFANLKGATKVGGAARRELLELTRKTGTLTTKSAYIVVETAAQEKGLKQKEMESLHGDKSLDFDESVADKTGDAPGFLILLLLFAPLALWRRKFAMNVAKETCAKK